MIIRNAGSDKDVIVEGNCVCCKKPWSVKAPLAGVIARQNGALIQVAFPDMPAAERELFVSGMCDDCFPKAPEDEDDDAEEEFEEEFDCDDADDCEDDDCDGCGGCDCEEE